MDYKILVNKENKLDNNYAPLNLVKTKSEYKDNIYLEEKTYEQFQKLQNEALKYGYQIDIASGYRDYNYQEKLFNELVLEKGYNYAYKYIAKPGHSEHQTGLALDIVIYEEDKSYIEHDIENLNATKWLHQNAHHYGFILRYPSDKEEITNYSYEPWHLRYVGQLATYLYNNNLTLEEYLKKTI